MKGKSQSHFADAKPASTSLSKTLQMPPLPSLPSIPSLPPLSSAEDALARARALRDASLPGDHGRPERWTAEYALGAREALLAGACVAAVVLVVRSGVVRYPTENDVPGRVVRGGKRLHGYIMKANDGDGVRFYHQPWLRRVINPGMRARKFRKLSDITIKVRIAAVDAPEMRHGSTPGQPYGKEALLFLRSISERQWARLTPHRYDQYGRIVGTVEVKNSNRLLRMLGVGRKNVSMELAKEGLAVVYKGQNACYGPPGKAAFDRAVVVATKAKKGLWSQGGTIVSPGQFKAAQKAVDGTGASTPGKMKGSGLFIFPAAVVSHILGMAGNMIGLGSTPRKRAKPRKRFFTLW